MHPFHRDESSSWRFAFSRCFSLWGSIPSPVCSSISCNVECFGPLDQHRWWRGDSFSHKLPNHNATPKDTNGWRSSTSDIPINIYKSNGFIMPHLSRVRVSLLNPTALVFDISSQCVCVCALRHKSTSFRSVVLPKKAATSASLA